MSTTISTHQPHHVPLLASLAVAGLIAAAGVVGVAWHESTTSADHAPAVTHPGPASNQNAQVAEHGTQQYGQYGHYYRGQRIGLGDFKSTTSGGKTVDGP